MNIKNKEFIDELIDYRKNRKPINYLIEAYNHLGDYEVVILIGWLLSWQKETTLGWQELDKLDIDTVQYKKFYDFFRICPIINEIFALNLENISWASIITDTEKIEIRDYIHINYKLQFRSRIWKKN